MFHSAKAELSASRIFNGKPHTVMEWLSAADNLEATFGVDQHIVMVAKAIRREARAALTSLEKRDAAGQ